MEDEHRQPHTSTAEEVQLSGDTTLFRLGLQAGLALSLIGAVIEYLLARRRTQSGFSRQLPGCLLYMAGGLALLGAIALLVSFILNGSIGPALFLGAGVLGGFYLGFALLFLGYLLLKSFWPGRWE